MAVHTQRFFVHDKSLRVNVPLVVVNVKNISLSEVNLQKIFSLALRSQKIKFFFAALEGREGGMKDGSKEGRVEGRKGGRKEGGWKARKDGEMEGRRKDGRGDEGREEGWWEVRNVGRKYWGGGGVDEGKEGWKR